MRSLADRFRVAPIVTPPAPRAVRGAIWQAGVTKGSHRKRVLLNGEPLALCFAAGRGWALCQPEPHLTACRPSAKAPLGLAYLIDEFSNAVLKQGRVQIVAADED